MWKWEKGRQGSGYNKMLLFRTSWPIHFDYYLLHYPEQSYLPSHTDPVDGYKHYRLNIILKRPKDGGLFICPKPIWELGVGHRVVFFRSDEMVHGLTRIYEGSRWVLSFGWAIKRDDNE